MKAVHTFYSKPYIENTDSFNGFGSRDGLFSSAVLSLAMLKKHFEKTELVTDDIGKHLLVDILKLPYDSVRTDIQEIYGKYDARHWVVGKLKAYQVQEEPFLHADLDVFMFKPLPEHLLRSRIFTQNAESFMLNDDSLFNYSYALKSITEAGIYMPQSWKWNIIQGDFQEACNVGIYGCRDMNLNRLYAQEAFSFLDAPENTEFLKTNEENANKFCTTIEQYALQALCRYHGITMEYLFESPECEWSKFNEFYTHLIYKEKKSTSNMARLAEIIAMDFPEYIPRIDAAVKEITGLKSLFNEPAPAQ